MGPLGWALAGAWAAESVEVTVDGLRPGGQVRVGVYADDGRWLADAGSVAGCVVDAVDGVARCTIPVPRPGRYAVALMHDLDGDGVMDKNFLGIPTEGYGFSRDAPTGFRGPAFEAAAFDVGAGATVRAAVHARYGF